MNNNNVQVQDAVPAPAAPKKGGPVKGHGNNRRQRRQARRNVNNNNAAPVVQDAIVPVAPVAAPAPPVLPTAVRNYSAVYEVRSGRTVKPSQTKAQNAYDAPAPRPVFHVNDVLSLEKKEWAAKVLCDFDVIFGDLHRHPHPLIALERRRSETYAVEYLRTHSAVGNNAVILDIGGSPIRHAAAGRVAVHSCNPILDTADVTREANRDVNVALNTCANTFDECPHGPFDAVLSIHSLYYLDLPQLVRTIAATAQRRMVAAVHVFDDFDGSFCCGEARWERTGTNYDQVQMLVEGGTPYAHGALDWMRSSGIHVAGFTLTWSLLQTFGSTSVFVFNVRDGEIPLAFYPAKPSNLSGILNSNYEGQIDMRNFLSSGLPKSAATSILFTESRSYYAIGKWIIGVSGGRRVLRIARGVVAAVSFRLIGETRNSKSYAHAANVARNVLTESKMSDEDITTALPFVIAVAFTISLEDEASALESVGRFEGLMNHVNKLLAFDFSKSVPQRIISWFLSWAPSSVKQRFAHQPTAVQLNHAPFAPTPNPIYKYVIWAATAVLFGLAVRPLTRAAPPTDTIALIQTIPYRVQNASLYEIFVRIFRATIRAVLQLARPEPTYITYPGHLAVVDVCVHPRPLQPMHASATVLVPPVTLGNCVPQLGCVLAGIGLARYRPSVYRSCACNEYYAVRNRGVLDRGDDTLTEEFWEWAYRYEVEHPTIVDPHRPSKGHTHVKPLSFQTWISRFPAAKRAKVQRAYDNSGKTMVTPRLASSKSFVKKETAVTHFASEDKPQLSDPRLIQGKDDLYNISQGTWTVAFSKHVARCWNSTISAHRQHNFFYASGTNSNAVGHWFDESYKAAKQIAATIPGSRIVALEDDMNRFDATNGRPSLEFRLNIYRLHAVPRRAIVSFLDGMVTRGRTAHHIRYRVDATINSGQADTSVGNTIANKTVHHAVFVVTTEFSCMAILGDDNAAFLVVPADVSDAMILGTLLTVAGKLAGYRPEPVLLSDPRDMEFCSSRFWPSSIGTILGPKIGRVMAKTFWSLRAMTHEENMAHVRGIALGMLPDTAHIPVLRVLMPRLIALTSNVEAKFDPSQRMEHRFHVAQSATVCDETWSFVEHVYRLPANVFWAAEKFIEENLTQLPAILDEPHINMIAAVDVPPKSRPFRRTSQLTPEPAPLDECHERWCHMRPGSSSDEALMALLAPFYEEVVKRVFPHVLQVVEAALVAAKGNPVGALVTLYRHYEWVSMSFDDGVIAHLLHNVLSIVVPSGPWQATIHQLAYALLLGLVGEANASAKSGFHNPTGLPFSTFHGWVHRCFVTIPQLVLSRLRTGGIYGELLNVLLDTALPPLFQSWLAYARALFRSLRNIQRPTLALRWPSVPSLPTFATPGLPRFPSFHGMARSTSQRVVQLTGPVVAFARRLYGAPRSTIDTVVAFLRQLVARALAALRQVPDALAAPLAAARACAQRVANRALDAVTYVITLRPVRERITACVRLAYRVVARLRGYPSWLPPTVLEYLGRP